MNESRYFLNYCSRQIKQEICKGHRQSLQMCNKAKCSVNICLLRSCMRVKTTTFTEIFVLANAQQNYITDISNPCSYEHYWTSSWNKTWKKFRPIWDLNPWPLWYQCSALPTKLTSQLGAGHNVGPEFFHRFILILLLLQRLPNLVK